MTGWPLRDEQRATDRYFLTVSGSPEREVTKEEYVRAERSAGFVNTLGQPREPATASFSAEGISGRTVYGTATARELAAAGELAALTEELGLYGQQ